MAVAAGGPTIRRRALGRQLARAREACGLTQEDVAKRLAYSVAMVRRIENAKSGIKMAMLWAMMDLYSITDTDVRQAMQDLARDGSTRGWWSTQRSELRESYARYIGMEDEAETIGEYQSTSIPGLLQTEEYARALMAAAIPAMQPDTIARRVAVRMQRQDILTREHAPQLHVILDEGAVRRRVGGPDVWRAQLHHLIERSGETNVVVQVLPFELGAYPCAVGGFVQLGVTDFPPTVYVELDSSDLLLEGDAAGRYTLLFENLRTQALAPSLSVDLIRRVADEGR